jgi:ATPases involved in chromosome partitioning
MQKIAFHIQKGGTGKTTLSGNVAYLSGTKQQTVLIDADPQASASTWFIENSAPCELADALQGACKVQDAIVPVANQFYLIPTYGIDGQLKPYSESPGFVDEIFLFDDLCRELDGLGFTVCIFDMGPGMSRLEKRILSACDEVVTPLTPEYFSIDGVQIFRSELEKIERQYRKKIKHNKIVVNNLNQRFRRHIDYMEAFRELEYSLFLVHQDAKLAEAQMFHKSIFTYNPRSRTVSEIESLTRGLLWR